MPDESNAITSFKYDISSIDFTSGFFNKSTLNTYGNNLFSEYKGTKENPVDVEEVTTEGITRQKVTFKASESGRFYIGVYRTPWSSWNSSGRIESFFAIFYKHPNSDEATEASIDISFPSGYYDSTSKKKTLVITRTVYLNSFWIPTWSGHTDAEKTALKTAALGNKLIPILLYHSDDRRCFSYSGDTNTLDNYLGWCYPYYVGGTNDIQSTLVPSNIIAGYIDSYEDSGVTKNVQRYLFGSRIKTTFSTGSGISDGSKLPIFVLDMNNGQRPQSTDYTYTETSFDSNFAEGCIVPSDVAQEIDSGIYYFTGNQYTNSLAAKDFIPTVSNNGKTKAFIANKNVSSPSGVKFNGTVGIREYMKDTDPLDCGWDDSELSMACGIAFFMSATESDSNKRSFYTTGSWGVSQLFPALSVKTRVVNFYGLTDDNKVSGTVYVRDKISNNTYGWPEEGDTRPSWIKRNGYELEGWYTSRNYTTERKANYTVPDGTEEINLYAKWSTIPYKITYNPNGGTMDNTTQDYNIETNLRLYSAPERDGYTFNGWKCSVSTGGWSNTTYTASQLVGTGKYGDITLTAQWTATTYTATFEPNGGKFSDGDTSNKTKDYNINQILTAPYSISREGYKFAGWKVKSKVGNWLVTIYYDPDHQTNLKGESGMYGAVTFTAQWTVKQYEVTSSANPSSMGSATGSGTYDYNSSVTAKATANSGYKFVNWTIPSDLTLTSGTTVNSATIKFNMPAKNVSITANFEAREYSLSFDLNVGKGCPTSNDDDGGNVPSKPATRTVVFGGYYAGKNSSTGEAYTTFPGLATNGGPDDWSAYFDAWKWDYRFLGWFTASEGGIEITATSRYEIAGDSTLWAHWQATQKQYTVTWKDWDQVGTDNYIKRKTLDAGTLIASENPDDPVRTGYTFIGWQIQGQYSYDDVRKDLTLVAQYTPITYKVRFNKNKNSGSSTVEGTMADQQFTYDQAQNLTNNAFSRMGYTFNGWNESSTFKANPDYTNKQSVINLESTQGAIHNLYANWKAKRAKVNFDVNTDEETQSPVSPVSSIYVYFDTAYGSGVHDITRTGYTFLGWFTEKTGGSRVTSETILTSTDQEHTLYAHWQIIRYRIIFHPRKGSEVSDKKFSIETKFPLRIYDESERSGYEFLGWSTNSNGSNYKYPYVVNEFVAHNINLYAAWRIALRPFEPKPGEPGEPQDEFGIPIDELDPDCKYTLVLSVKGDRTSTDGKSKWQLQSYEGEYQNSVPYSWVNTIKVGDSTKLTPAQLKSAINDYVVFPMDVWRCRIRHTSAVLHVSLTEYQEDNTSFESSTDNDFSIPASCIPTIVTTKLHDGVITIKSLDLYANNMASTKRFIGNAKSSVLIDITSSSMNSGSELLYDAVPQAYGVKLEYVGSQQVGGDWVESKIRNIDPELVQDYITNSQNYKYSNTNEYRYKVENFIVSEIPFPKIEEHLFGARIRLKVFDTRHSNKD